MGVAAPYDLIAAVAIAAKVKERLGVDIDPVKLMTFMVDEWATLSGAAHIIHDMRKKPKGKTNG